MKTFIILFCGALFTLTASAVSPGNAAASGPIKDVPYGEHPLQKLNIYLPEGPGPFPYVIHIHGGGWWNGDKQWQSGEFIKRMKAAGCAFVAINYRFLPQAKEAGLFPPVLAPYHDARRALQFTRLHAAEWNLDPERVALAGDSAGACTALWLALSPEMADAASADEVARQSTRVRAAGVEGAQTSLDPQQMREWVGVELRYGGHAFGLPEGDFEEFLRRRGEFEKYFPEVSPAALLKKDSPPLWLRYGKSPDEEKKNHMYYVHSPMFGVGFQKLAAELGARCYLQLPKETTAVNAPSQPLPKDTIDFLIGELLK